MRSYRVAFLCSSIVATNGEYDLKLSKEEMMLALKQELMTMRQTAMLYQKLSSSIAPSVYGHVGN